MTWQPAHAATDIRPIVPNLIGFIKANQTAVLAWASPSRTLANFAECYPTSQVWDEKDFPHFGVVRERIETDDSDDGLRITYTLIFIIEVAAEFAADDKATALAQLKVDTKNYVYAVESIFLNIPNTTLFANVSGARHGYRSITSSDPLEAAAGNTKAMFQTQMNAVLKFTENP